ncbi:CHAT domain-containing protein, partial [Frankia sp. ACN1ag]|uniref:CHAT domain-containing protein n=1 Tax=Frankia sp. ACN1ag TaxID=102891 RepID=UPI00128EEC12
RFERIGELGDLDEAILAGQDAAGVVGASPRVRVQAAVGWGRAAAGGERWDEAVAGFTAAAELVGQLAPRSLDRSDQEHLLVALRNLGADAAVCCVQAGLPERAVELFEAGRGVLLGQALDTRTDLTDLTAAYPRLAEAFTRLRDELDSADPTRTFPSLTTVGPDGISAAYDDGGRRRSAALAFDALIEQIRGQDGFEGFLRPPSIRELHAAAVDGPVVIVAVSEYGSHALILIRDEVHTLPLPRLTSEAVDDRVTAFVTESSPAGEEELGDVLGWLWDQLAAPVLGRLGLTGHPRDQEWPRVWWCTSGLLSFLPLHAAGHHHTCHDAVPATVLDRAISSYTPTVRALIHARRPLPEPVPHRQEPHIVAVAMTHTPPALDPSGEDISLNDLPGAKEEVGHLEAHFPGRVRPLIDLRATYATVTEALPACRWAHFACHGMADLADPSASRLFLHDHRTRPLTVLDVTRLHLDGAELAFLSACETSRPGDLLPDEAIHLASAFQLAGYRHVIATLWPIDDTAAADLTDDIYGTLAANGDRLNPARALHDAVLGLRALNLNSPRIWASHLHTGA